MAGVAVLAAALTTPVTSTLKVFAGGADITGDVKWNTFTVTDSGTNAKGTASMTIEAAASGFASITDQAMLRVEEPANTSAPEVFRGFIRARRPGKDPRHPTLELIADDISTLLDDAFIPIELRRPETMQARIGYLWGQYAGQFLSGDLSYVLSVGSTLPLQRFEAVTLRQAIEMTIAQASSSADYYVDMLGRLHVFTSETNNAPFSINADSPGGGAISPETLDVEFDSQSYANRVYVKGATPAASLYVQDEAAIAAANGLVRTTVVQAGDVTTATMARAIGNMYLGRVKNAKPRGLFITSSPDDGWRGGQSVTVTSADHAISGQTYKIARVTTKVLVPGVNMKRQYRVEFGGATAGSGIDGQLPIIAGASSGVYLLDQLSSSLLSTAASAAEGGIGPSPRRYVLTGLYNSDFFDPPPGPDAPIDNTTNPLPYWLQATGGGASNINLYSRVDSSGSGRSLEFVVDSGSGSAQKGIEQLVPVRGGNAADTGGYYHVLRGTIQVGSSASANIEAFITGNYQTITHNQVGSTSTSAHVTLATIGAGNQYDFSVVLNSGVIPANAYYASWQFYIYRTAGSDTGSFNLIDARIEEAPRFYPQGAIAIRTTNQSIASSTWTAMQLNDTDISDPFGFHDPASNNTRFIIPNGWSGTYLCVGVVQFASGATGERFVGWTKNGGGTTSPGAYDQDRRTTSTGGNAMIVHMVTHMELVEGDYVELMAWQSQGVALNANGRGAIYYLGSLA